jgi:hypothetical protein
MPQHHALGRVGTIEPGSAFTDGMHDHVGGGTAGLGLEISEKVTQCFWTASIARGKERELESDFSDDATDFFKD